MVDSIRKREVRSLEGGGFVDVARERVLRLVKIVANRLLGVAAASEVNLEHQERVLKMVEEGYGEFLKVAEAGFGELEEVPKVPSLEVVKNAVLEGLTTKQLEYMMSENRTPFNFQLKLSAPSYRKDLVVRLLGRQPNHFNPTTYPYLGLEGFELFSEYSLRDEYRPLEWKWSFFQGGEGKVEGWDDPKKPLGERQVLFRNQLPEGMKGRDLFDWSSAMASGLEKGRPLGFSREKSGSIVLDQEGGFKAAGSSDLEVAIGQFVAFYEPGGREECYKTQVVVDTAAFNAVVPNASFRAGVSGSINPNDNE